MYSSKNKSKNLYKEQGITLIALVVTIVVLLILAGVSISMLSGDDGIIEKSTDAKSKTEQAEKEEKEKLSDMEDLINKYTTGIDIKQVTDENPGILEIDETNENTYVINSIEDLVFFASDVANGNNYKGKIVILSTSLDFNSTKSYVDPFRTNYGDFGYNGELKTLLTSGKGFCPIGIGNDEVGSNSFSGTFDGKGNQIKNLYINEQNETQNKLGFFAVNYGNIENLNLVNVNIKRYEENSSLTGGLVGQNRTSATIKNCSVSGNIKIDGPGTAVGIAGHNMGIMEDCYNLSNIKIESKIINGIALAGIANASTGLINRCLNTGKLEIIVEGSITQTTIIGIGGISNYSENIIQECYNIGDITVECLEEGEQLEIQAGGICGSATSKILNCYNNANIKVNSKNGNLYIGGIKGTGNASIENCYNVGNIKFESERNLFVGGISSLPTTITNCYYLNQDDFTNTESNVAGKIKTEEEMKKDEFVNLLNIVGNVWKIDNNKNNGYPIFIWQ